jgi:hypothetical protein
MILFVFRHRIADWLPDRWRHHCSGLPLQSVTQVCSLPFSVRVRRPLLLVKSRLGNGLLGTVGSRRKAVTRCEGIEGGRPEPTRRLPGCNMIKPRHERQPGLGSVPFSTVLVRSHRRASCMLASRVPRYRVACMVRNSADAGNARSLARTLGGAFAATATAGAPSTLIFADALPLQYVFVSRAIQDHGFRIIRNARGCAGRLRGSLIERRLCSDARRQ